MRGKRLGHTLRLWATPSTARRTAYIKKHHIFREMGDNCMISDRKVPLYADLIRMGSNVRIASDVALVTHDVAHVMLNKYLESTGQEGSLREKVGVIDIGDNVFIGANSLILGNVRIGSNVIIGAFSLVNKDIPDNSVAAGVPARVIGTFDDFLSRRLSEETYPEEMKPARQEVSKELADWCWEQWNEHIKEQEK